MLRTKLLTCIFVLWTVLFILPLGALAQVVNIPDPNLRTAIAEALGKTESVPITKAEMQTLLDLQAGDKQIGNLTGLALATNLQDLNLRNNLIDDISELTELKRLNSVNLGENVIEDISPLKGKIIMRSLVIDNTFVSDLTPLAGLINLESLNISNNDFIEDLSPLRNLKRLRELTMHNLEGLATSNNKAADLSPLEGLISLINFHSFGTPISDLTPLASLPKLRLIDIGSAGIKDLSPLEGLTGLRELYLFRNEIEDISPLASLTGLTRLSLKQNEISDVSALAELRNLRFIDLEDNRIADFTKLNVLRLGGTVILGDNNPGFIIDAPKILGPWLWVIVPIGEEKSGEAAASSGIDFLEQASEGNVTEQMVATQGATQGTQIGKRVWTVGKLSRRGGNNINELVNEIGLGIDDVNHHVAYGSIILDSQEEKESTMFVGGSDVVKVWLNGEAVYSGDVDGDAENYQENFRVTLKKGDNYLLVAVYEGKGWWSGFFGLDPATKFDVRIPNYSLPAPHPADINGDGKVSVLDMLEISFYFGRDIKPAFSSLDLNSDGVIDISDLVEVAQHIDAQAAAPAALSPAIVQDWITLAWARYDGSIEFQKGITNLENILISLTSKKTVDKTVRKTALFANYPNPFNPETWIPYQLAKPAEVSLTIYAANGKIVRTLALGHLPAGVYKTRNRAAYWDGRNDVGESVASGIYFYTLTAGDFTATRKMLILK
ncbi:hypothetical protein C6501_03255 [Candidatus Poribacteria bacterium]|nr:MAG: hypothetical protein C6501_03255 [Candidatus Poribacteria bacterium]